MSHIHTEPIKEGVECDIYSFVGDDAKDLAIIHVKSGYKTPLQKVVDGIETVEGYLEGEGMLTVRSSEGQATTYDFGPGLSNDAVSVNVGETMQWRRQVTLLLCFMRSAPHHMKK